MWIAVLCSEERVPRWAGRTLDRLFAIDGVQLLAVFVAAEPHAPPDGGSAALGRWTSRRVPALAAVALPAALGHVPVIYLDQPGAREGLAQADLVIDCRVCAGAPLQPMPRFGICMLAIEGLTGLAGIARGFQAFCRKQAYLRFAVIAARGGQAATCTLRDGAVRLIYSYAKSLESLFDAASHALVSVARELALAGSAEVRRRFDPRPDLAREPKPPSALALGTGAVRSAWRFAATTARTHLWFEQWGVGLCSVPVQRFLGLSSVPAADWLPQRRGLSFIADPFAVPGDPDTILAEYYDERDGRGFIVEHKRDTSAQDRQVPAVTRGFHLSYPYLVSDGDDLYCVPEAGESGRVTLFKARPDRGGWDEVGTLIEFPGVDPTLFVQGGRWWLLCTALDRRELPPGSTKLYAWSAERLAGPWRPHPLNPVKMDVRCSRPAGPPFIVDGRLFRPTQDCSETYGGAVSLVEIVTLTETAFEERFIRRVTPDPNGPYPNGFHTLGPAGHCSLVDGKRLVFSPILPFIKARRWLMHSRHVRRLAGTAPLEAMPASALPRVARGHSR
jgi:hypothetical protein